MRARGYFWILTSVMVLTLALLTLMLFRQGVTWYFIAAEILIVIVIGLLALLYSRVVKPLEIIGNGMDLLKEQDFSSRLGYVGQKDADRVVDIFNKMMAQLKEERLRVREQNHFLDLLIKSSPMGVVIMDLDENVSSVNPIGCRMLGVEDSDVIGKPLHHLDKCNLLIDRMSQMKRGESETVRSSDGNVYKCTRASFMDRGFHHTFYLIEQMTEELLKAEKKAYGQVIRMISHEVNNSMAGVTSILDTVADTIGFSETGSINGSEESVAAPDDISESGSFDGSVESVAVPDNISESGSIDGSVKSIAALDDIADIREMLTVASDRCISLSKFITAFADVVKIPEPQFTPVSLNDFISSRIRFIESICAGRPIVVRTLLSDSDCKVMLDEVLMEQALLNIVKNGAEAMESESTNQQLNVVKNGAEANGVDEMESEGIIKISTSVSATHFTITIADNGTPISPEIQNKLFTPFFSTKTNGQGIGLIMIREILLKHGFHFSLHTDADGWTRFVIGNREQL